MLFMTESVLFWVIDNRTDDAFFDRQKAKFCLLVLLVEFWSIIVLKRNLRKLIINLVYFFIRVPASGLSLQSLVSCPVTFLRLQPLLLFYVPGSNYLFEKFLRSQLIHTDFDYFWYFQSSLGKNVYWKSEN